MFGQINEEKNRKNQTSFCKATGTGTGTGTAVAGCY